MILRVRGNFRYDFFFHWMGLPCDHDRFELIICSARERWKAMVTVRRNGVRRLFFYIAGVL